LIAVLRTKRTLASRNSRHAKLKAERLRNSAIA
jgi:hypothetical protein